MNESELRIQMKDTSQTVRVLRVYTLYNATSLKWGVVDNHVVYNGLRIHVSHLKEAFKVDNPTAMITRIDVVERTPVPEGTKEYTWTDFLNLLW